MPSESSRSDPQQVPILGYVMPHAELLTTICEQDVIYKVMSIDRLLQSVTQRYLHFNRVDSYFDFPGADHHDGEQLPEDRASNASAKFQEDPAFTAETYYDKSRARTYAFCTSLENTNHLWAHYGGNDSDRKVCVAFSFGKLRSRLNDTLQTGKCELRYGERRCANIFSINYGKVEYINKSDHRLNAETFCNPIQYTYLKDQRFVVENEFRISLSAFGMGAFGLDDSSELVFPPSLQVDFDFCAALQDGTVRELWLAHEGQLDILRPSLGALRIVPTLV